MDYQYYDEPDYADEEDEGSGGGGVGSDVVYVDQDSTKSQSNSDYDDDDFENVANRLWESYEHCILPSLSQVTSYIVPLLLGCLLCRLLSTLYARHARLVTSASVGTSSSCSWQEANSLKLAPLHLINALCGAGVLYATLGQKMLILLLLSGISFVLLQLVRLGKGQRAAVAIAALSIGSQFLYELAIWQKRDDWPQLRGLQMVTNMKVISLAFDLTASGAPGLRMPSIPAYLGYILNPASCALGPWLSYARYLDSLHKKPPLRRNLFHMMVNVLLSLVALVISNCIAPALGELHVPEVEYTTRHSDLSHWLLMYTGAMSVRTSHYFVSFLSQAQLAAAGQQLDTTTTPHSSSKQLLGELVVRPWHIEWPRSLSALVRCWNVPMHEWLKRYVYSTSKLEQRSRQNTIVAVFCTYVVSSLLHGMDFRIYLVLLSLATFAEGETMLRRHLARLCNACVAANPCPGAERCRYAHCPQQRGWLCVSSWLVGLTNLAFTLLAIFHLAYLGVVLLNETLVMEADNELPFLYHWASAGYLSHYVGIGMFVLYLFIS
ncbi:protein-serine O-palmitoleoyltransferase porcupine [Drosophila novamexicana]|uniref:protein-serine O-palmitoleoyltransferase porcupine n=1 Tax=Drosophila novamexicana TaxID=47314 RepID=UPI0011E5AB29|nr:protein-serine O-palmitoleoyltransferase porcupine [Drosophila novamexicana]XP_030563184.1 protein-serine O-palmitoleoyltransferase porcupine [Drosophila novamexicana]